MLPWEFHVGNPDRSQGPSLIWIPATWKVTCSQGQSLATNSCGSYSGYMLQVCSVLRMHTEIFAKTLRRSCYSNFGSETRCCNRKAFGATDTTKLQPEAFLCYLALFATSDHWI